MKATGIVRRIDALGRIVLPVELREGLGISEKTRIHIYRDGSMIVLEKYEEACTFCGRTTELLEHGGRAVCKECMTAMAETLKGTS